MPMVSSCRVVAAMVWYVRGDALYLGSIVFGDRLKQIDMYLDLFVKVQEFIAVME